MTILYLDCSAGVAGDMLLAALIDAGVGIDAITNPVSKVEIEGWDLRIDEVVRGGLRATKATVQIDRDSDARSYRTIADLLDRADLADDVKNRAQRCFRLLAEAEARVHGTALEDVHLHEVGAVDAIVDIVGVCAAVVELSPDAIVASPLPTGSGTTGSAHGPLPVPAPAVLEIAAATGLPLVGSGEGEVTTPTGAALVGGLATSFGSLPAMEVEAVGYGAGDRQREIPNVVRALVGQAHEEDEPPAEARALLLETTVDDMNPEWVPHVIQRLIDAGAHDAWVTPVVMKKGRPGLVISALVPPQRRAASLDILFRETTTLGVRIAPMQRETLDRKITTVSVEGHPVRVKLGIRGDEIVTASPEYDDARDAASATALPLKEVYARVLAIARDEVGGLARRGESAPENPR